MASSTSRAKFVRPRHRAVASILANLNAPFLARAQCFFGGGTRIALALDEYRESADIDFLCSSRIGYRDLRSTIDSRSLGEIVRGPIQLAREVVADRYGIRTFVESDGAKIKFEIVSEGRIDLSGSMDGGLRVPCLDQASCFAEKFLANDDRWADESVLSRDVIDLAYMTEGWRPDEFLKGALAAHAAYGDSIERSARAAAKRLLNRKDYFKRCVEGLRLKEVGTLTAGLRKLSAKGWSCKSGAKRP